MPSTPISTDPIVELIGIYNADGTLGGELRYLIGKYTGRAHCGLCDITHGRLRRRPELDRALSALGIPVRFVHADEATADERAASAGALPCVIGRTRAGRHRIVLGPAELDGCDGDIDAFVRALEQAR